MRIDMTIYFEPEEDCAGYNILGDALLLRLTVEQAKALRNEITKHLRGQGRDNVKTIEEPED